MLAASCLAGCELYVAPDETPPPPPDQRCPAYVWCSDSTLWQSDPSSDLCYDPLRYAIEIGDCADGCGPTRPEARCVSTQCTMEEAARHCYVLRTPSCPPETICADPASFVGCTSPDGVAAAMVGDWHGTATWPDGAVIEVTLHIDAVGHYSAYGSDRHEAIYGGADGEGPLKRIHVLARSEVGAFAIMDVEGDYGEDWYEAELTELRVDGDRMTFLYHASWQSCPPAELPYELTRD